MNLADITPFRKFEAISNWKMNSLQPLTVPHYYHNKRPRDYRHWHMYSRYWLILLFIFIMIKDYVICKIFFPNQRLFLEWHSYIYIYPLVTFDQKKWEVFVNDMRKIKQFWEVFQIYAINKLSSTVFSRIFFPLYIPTISISRSSSHITFTVLDNYVWRVLKFLRVPRRLLISYEAYSLNL